MKHNTRNSIALSLMLLILFSTIGFNVIKTFCGGCDMEMVKVAYTISAEKATGCDCCDKNVHGSDCCQSKTANAKPNPSKNFLAKLKFDSTEAKGKSIAIQFPHIFIHSITACPHRVENCSSEAVANSYFYPPPLSGRSILSLICVFRN